jgi:hypothetical protein
MLEHIPRAPIAVSTPDRTRVSAMASGVFAREQRLTANLLHAPHPPMQRGLTVCSSARPPHPGGGKPPCAPTNPHNPAT